MVGFTHKGSEDGVYCCDKGLRNVDFGDLPVVSRLSISGIPIGVPSEKGVFGYGCEIPKGGRMDRCVYVYQLRLLNGI